MLKLISDKAPAKIDVFIFCNSFEKNTLWIRNEILRQNSPDSRKYKQIKENILDDVYERSILERKLILKCIIIPTGICVFLYQESSN